MEARRARRIGRMQDFQPLSSPEEPVPHDLGPSSRLPFLSSCEKKKKYFRIMYSFPSQFAGFTFLIYLKPRTPKLILKPKSSSFYSLAVLKSASQRIVKSEGRLFQIRTCWLFINGSHILRVTSNNQQHFAKDILIKSHFKNGSQVWLPNDGAFKLNQIAFKNRTKK